jgi:VWFA-related protein
MKYGSLLLVATIFGFVVPLLQSQADPFPGEIREQQAPATTDPSAQAAKEPHYRIDSTLVNVNVLVTDEDGRVLTGLKRGNFRVFDNGSPQKVIDFAPTSAPITIVILMEYSASSYSYFASKSAVWGTQFLSHLEPRDWVALITFDLRSKVQVDFTHNQFAVRDAITHLGYPQLREVNLYDSLIDTLDKLEGVSGRKSILLLATGQNSISAANLDEVRKRLRNTDATIFCVGLAEVEDLLYDGGINYQLGKNALSVFAKQTGGLAFFPRFEAELPGIFRTVVSFLRSEYTLTFRPPNDIRDGLYHRLKVEIVGADGKPLKVTNEKGRQRKVEVYAREGYTAPIDVTQ